MTDKFKTIAGTLTGTQDDVAADLLHTTTSIVHISHVSEVQLKPTDRRRLESYKALVSRLLSEPNAIEKEQPITLGKVVSSLLFHVKKYGRAAGTPNDIRGWLEFTGRVADILIKNRRPYTRNVVHAALNEITTYPAEFGLTQADAKFAAEIRLKLIENPRDPTLEKALHVGADTTKRPLNHPKRIRKPLPKNPRFILGN